MDWDKIPVHVFMSKYIAETCASRQLAPLNPERQIIQDQDFSTFDVNAH